jgi:hypothetical protein
MDYRERSLMILAVLAVAGCAGESNGPAAPGSGGSGGAATTSSSSSGAPSCEARHDTALGRCELADGGDCTGVPDEERVFRPLADGEALRIVIGPQSASMFVLGLRTGGIFPGSVDNPADPDNPNVAIELHGDPGMMARYNGRPAFVPAADDPEVLEQPALFVVVDGSGAQLDGLELTATAEVVDRAGEQRCASATFIADAPGP